MKTSKTTKLFLTLLLIVTMLLLAGGNVQATLQANQNTQYTKTATLVSWVSAIREMEATGGAMGLTETIGDDLTAETSNNIDVHCVRTTEYGAMAILSASGYGNPSNEQAITTTTGNNTGVILGTSIYEWTAGIADASSAGLSSVDSRYYDLYTISDATSAKAGDALGASDVSNPGCNGWHSAANYNWITAADYGFIRGGYGIFSFSGHLVGTSTSVRYGRVVVVCGSGL